MKYKKFKLYPVSLLVILSIICQSSFAQIGITAILPPGSLYMRSQLWNVSLSNIGNQRGLGVLKLEMKDLQTHQTVLTAVTNRFVLPTGAAMLQQQSLEPVIYTSFLSGNNNFLPVGQYEVCYQLSYTTNSADAKYTAEDCEQVMVEPLSAPMLVFPENDSIVHASALNFSWVPPTPINMFSNLNYDIQIAEVYDGQSPSDAIQNNLPLQQATNLERPFFSFPLSGPQLEQGRSYVWQVIAKDGQRLATRSEAWIFKKDSEKANVRLLSTIYLLMDDQTKSPGIADSGVLRIKYVTHANTHLVTVQLKDEQEHVITAGKREIRQGDNYLEFALNKRFHSGNLYTIAIIDTDGKSHTLKFTSR